jgi:hypothetical protein
VGCVIYCDATTCCICSMRSLALDVSSFWVKWVGKARSGSAGL